MIAYNEEELLENAVTKYYNEIYLNSPEGSEFILYLDGCKDNTPKIAKRLAERLELNVIDCKENKGYFYAMKSALSNAKNDFVFYSDCSGKHDPSDFWGLAEKIDSYDIVNGFRSLRTDTSYRKNLSASHRSFISFFFGIPLNDYNTGFKLVRKKVLDEVLESINKLTITFSTELLIRSYKKGFKITSAPVNFIHIDGRKDFFANPRIFKIVFVELLGYIRLKFELLRK